MQDDLSVERKPKLLTSIDYKGLTNESGITSDLKIEYSSIEIFWKNKEAMNKWYEMGTKYWKDNVTNDMNGMLGGFTNVHERDIKESSTLLNKVLQELKENNQKLSCLECGAGNGRVTKYLLERYFDEIDIEDINDAFLQKAKLECDKVRNTYAIGLEQLDKHIKIEPTYHCIWIQWCACFLKDLDFVNFLLFCYELLHDGGIICFKENISGKGFVIDSDDGSITRSDRHYRYLFKLLEPYFILKENVIQKDWEKGLFQVRMYCLKKIKL
ncbi:hypothetical protein ABK040_009910 [Willaertia magna]